MKQSVNGTMSEVDARAGSYLPTVEVPALIGIERDPRELGRTMRREGLRPVRVGHAYWWDKAADYDHPGTSHRWQLSDCCTCCTCCICCTGRISGSDGFRLRTVRVRSRRWRGRPGVRLPRGLLG